eukprot:TRINITY_DN9043_c0_g2_i3.p2 TRINITY_DN9043_c0_g2~~TRINITY_DN9043_c0_g2_i3.p2  ORF type:complete len:207 (+),score=-14.79 TRINITY_DN9043_c0_g2_i3:1416-2036(+)
MGNRLFLLSTSFGCQPVEFQELCGGLPDCRVSADSGAHGGGFGDVIASGGGRGQGQGNGQPCADPTRTGARWQLQAAGLFRTAPRVVGQVQDFWRGGQGAGIAGPAGFGSEWSLPGRGRLVRIGGITLPGRMASRTAAGPSLQPELQAHPYRTEAGARLAALPGLRVCAFQPLSGPGYDQCVSGGVRNDAKSVGTRDEHASEPLFE